MLALPPGWEAVCGVTRITEEGKKYHLVYVSKLADVLASGVTSQPSCASAS